MTDDDLYQALIIDHNRAPRNRGEIERPTHQAFEQNPLCGDEIGIHVEVAAGRIARAAFQGQGCAVTVASASLLTESIRGKTVDEALRLARDVAALVHGGAPPDLAASDLHALAGVARYPIRAKCALLAWYVLEKALSGGGGA